VPTASIAKPSATSTTVLMRTEKRTHRDSART
jgi:hypothetical protein